MPSFTSSPKFSNHNTDSATVLLPAKSAPLALKPATRGIFRLIMCWKRMWTIICSLCYYFVDPSQSISFPSWQFLVELLISHKQALPHIWSTFSFKLNKIKHIFVEMNVPEHHFTLYMQISPGIVQCHRAGTSRAQLPVSNIHIMIRFSIYFCFPYLSVSWHQPNSEQQ